MTDHRKVPKNYKRIHAALFGLEAYDLDPLEEYITYLQSQLQKVKSQGIIDIVIETDMGWGEDLPEYFLVGFIPLTEKELVKVKHERALARAAKLKRKASVEETEKLLLEKLKLKYENSNEGVKNS